MLRLPGLLLALFFAVAIYATTPTETLAAGCRAPDDAGDFTVHVNIDVGEPTIHNHLSKEQLGAFNIHGGRRVQVLGTAQTGVQMRLSLDSRYTEWKNVYCFWVTEVTVDLSYHQLDVNIAAEYAPGSCQYEAVLDHEMEHVEVAQRVMEPYAQQIRQALTSLAIPTPHAPGVANSPEDARAAVQEAFRKTLAPVRDQMSRVLAEQQAYVDSIDNYRRTWKRCRRW